MEHVETPLLYFMAEYSQRLRLALLADLLRLLRLTAQYIATFSRSIVRPYHNLNILLSGVGYPS